LKLALIVVAGTPGVPAMNGCGRGYSARVIGLLVSLVGLNSCESSYGCIGGPNSCEFSYGELVRVEKRNEGASGPGIGAARNVAGGFGRETFGRRRCGVGRPAHNCVGRPAHNRVS